MTQPPNPGSPAPASPTPESPAAGQPYPAPAPAPAQPYPAPAQPYPAAGYQPNYPVAAQPYPPSGQPYPAAGYPAPAQTPTSTGREILRVGWFNYVMLRWGPKNSAAKLAVEMALLIGFFLILAILAKLAQG